MMAKACSSVIGALKLLVICSKDRLSSSLRCTGRQKSHALLRAWTLVMTSNHWDHDGTMSTSLSFTSGELFQLYLVVCISFTVLYEYMWQGDTHSHRHRSTLANTLDERKHTQMCKLIFVFHLGGFETRVEQWRITFRKRNDKRTDELCSGFLVFALWWTY